MIRKTLLVGAQVRGIKGWMQELRGWATVRVEGRLVRCVLAHLGCWLEEPRYLSSTCCFLGRGGPSCRNPWQPGITGKGTGGLTAKEGGSLGTGRPG